MEDLVAVRHGEILRASTALSYRIRHWTAGVELADRIADAEASFWRHVREAAPLSLVEDPILTLGGSRLLSLCP